MSSINKRQGINSMAPKTKEIPAKQLGCVACSGTARLVNYEWRVHRNQTSVTMVSTDMRPHLLVGSGVHCAEYYTSSC